MPTHTQTYCPNPIVHYELCIVLSVPYAFSAKERDAETGLSYFGARYYSSDLSIWLSVDPMSDKYPSTSPYAYCRNNPVIMIDANGLFDSETRATRVRDRAAKKYGEDMYGNDANCLDKALIGVDVARERYEHHTEYILKRALSKSERIITTSLKHSIKLRTFINTVHAQKGKVH